MIVKRIEKEDGEWGGGEFEKFLSTALIPSTPRSPYFTLLSSSLTFFLLVSPFLPVYSLEPRS